MPVDRNIGDGTPTGDAVQYQIEADEPVWMTVVKAVESMTERAGTVENGAIEALEPLGEAIDPEALDTVVRSATTGGTRSIVEFEYGGHQVTVLGTDTVQVTEAEA